MRTFQLTVTLHHRIYLMNITKYSFPIREWALLYQATYFLYWSCYGIYGWINFWQSWFLINPTVTNDFSLNHKNLYYIRMHANSVFICAYSKKSNVEVSMKNSIVNIVYDWTAEWAIIVSSVDRPASNCDGFSDN